jgi:hypothetical protein
MPTHPLPYRIHDFLTRQIAWSQSVIDELDAFCALPDTSDLDEAAQLQQRREREARSMTREYNGLLHEWRETRDVAPEIREAITRHSDEARSLLEEVKIRYGNAERAAQRKKTRNHDALNDLRRGRRSVNIYRSGVLVSPGFVDKKA